jgi:hypothetical protein
LQAHLLRRHDDDHAAVLVAPGRLDQERHVVHDDPVGRRRRHPPQELLADGRVGDRFELLAPLVGDERTRRERGPVERPVGGQDLRPELLHERGEHLGAFDDLARDQVGVDHDCAPVGEQLRDGRLAGADAAREPDHEHGAKSTSARSRSEWSAADAAQDTLPPAEERVKPDVGGR